ncbi:MAG TPA: hypothetical protein VLT81_12575 [Chondromyces sp.]|nr:hypothetical protein [Chondromyces sp.]
MNPPLDRTDPGSVRAGFVAIGLTAIVIAGAVAMLFGPVVPMALTGDSYQWIQHAHLAAHQPKFLLADLDTFYRPSTTWTLVADRLLWGGFTTHGYRVSSLILHGLAALSLAAVGWRLGLGRAAATAVALVWVTSPFTDESALVVAYRFQPLLLLSWMGLVAVWPRDDERWRTWRIAVAAAMVVAAAASKESWIVTPALVAALEYERRRSFRGALIPAALVGAAAALYVALYFVAFPGSKSYFELGPHIIAKIPSQMAAFFYLEESVPVGPSVTWAGAVATAVVIMIVAACLRWRVPGTLVALCVMVLPSVPTILVAYMPQRYLAIPYAGFLLLIALWVSALGRKYPRWRSSIRVVALAAVVIVIAAGAAIVRADIEDHRTMTAAHAQLLREAGSVVAATLDGGLVAVVRDEQTSPLLELVDSLVGYPKFVFVRPHDPYGLIDAAALFEWVAAREGTRVEPFEGWATAGAASGGVILVHRDGTFVNLGTTPRLEDEVKAWRDSGRSVRVIRANRLD